MLKVFSVISLILFSFFCSMFILQELTVDYYYLISPTVSTLFFSLSVVAILNIFFTITKQYSSEIFAGTTIVMLVCTTAITTYLYQTRFDLAEKQVVETNVYNIQLLEDNLILIQEGRVKKVINNFYLTSDTADFKFKDLKETDLIEEITYQYKIENESKFKIKKFFKRIEP